jgi:hypothetical protein
MMPFRHRMHRPIFGDLGSRKRNLFELSTWAGMLNGASFLSDWWLVTSLCVKATSLTCLDGQGHYTDLNVRNSLMFCFLV